MEAFHHKDNDVWPELLERLAEGGRGEAMKDAAGGEFKARTRRSAGSSVRCSGVRVRHRTRLAWVRDAVVGARPPSR
jgi:hypothetical protein